jgi:DNA-binding NtrC family response regulator
MDESKDELPDVPLPKHGETLPLAAAKAPAGAVRRFRLTVMEGAAKGATWESRSDRCSVGSHEMNDLALADPTVSRFHCEILMGEGGARVKDLDSLNSTIVDGVVVKDAFLRGGSLLRLGRALVRFDFEAEQNRVPLSEKTTFGSLAGGSVAMRTAFALMDRAAGTDATVLLEGETGTGKGKAAEAIHAMSPRKDRAFLVVDCGAIPANLLESELFGHEKGSFTGATQRRVGAFEEASGGTVFLDEIGELPLDLQPKLLRVLENREIRRLGTNAWKPVDVRVIAATNRDLRGEVNAGRFRPDLFFRLAVVRVPLPPLRQRPEDIPLIVEKLLKSMGADPAAFGPLQTPEWLAGLKASAWPGNVRELRNYVERCLVFQDALPIGEGGEAPPAASGGAVDASVAYAEARRLAIDHFEREYVKALLARHGGKVAAAASAADVDRVYLYRLMRRHGIEN